MVGDQGLAVLQPQLDPAARGRGKQRHRRRRAQLAALLDALDERSDQRLEPPVQRQEGRPRGCRGRARHPRGRGPQAADQPAPGRDRRLELRRRRANAETVAVAGVNAPEQRRNQTFVSLITEAAADELPDRDVAAELVRRNDHVEPRASQAERRQDPGTGDGARTGRNTGEQTRRQRAQTAARPQKWLVGRGRHEPVAEADFAAEAGPVRDPREHRVRARVEPAAGDLLRAELAPEPLAALEHGDVGRLGGTRLEQPLGRGQAADAATDDDHVTPGAQDSELSSSAITAPASASAISGASFGEAVRANLIPSSAARPRASTSRS